MIVGIEKGRLKTKCVFRRPFVCFIAIFWNMDSRYYSTKLDFNKIDLET
ncbi:hypothetical protein [Neisseria sicca]|nr:hypothetical protein [Neisseria sicca]